MRLDERESAEAILNRISHQGWAVFLNSADGSEFRLRLDSFRGVMRRLRIPGGVGKGKPVSEFLDVYGSRFLSDESVGPWVREMLIRALPSKAWNKLSKVFRETSGERAENLHGLATQRGKGSRVMAEYWHSGSIWARKFCNIVGLPKNFSRLRGKPHHEEEDVVPFDALGPLHDFQEEVYQSLMDMLKGGLGQSAMLSLPTGAGKTRAGVEAICDYIAVSCESGNLNGRNIVLWIAHSNELLMQAWESFKQVWQVPPRRDRPVHRPSSLKLIRLWGGAKIESVIEKIQTADSPVILLAGIDQLGSWNRVYENPEDTVRSDRMICVVVDEAHSAITSEYSAVLKKLGLRQERVWKVPPKAPLVFGLSATPWRNTDDTHQSLMRYFQRRLLRPETLGGRPISELQKRGILSNVRWEKLKITDTPAMSPGQRRRFVEFHEIPKDYLEQLGRESSRNARIVERLKKFPKKSKVLVFACSIFHAEMLALLFNRVCGNGSAAVVTGETPRAERLDAIERFRSGDLRFLCNVGVLTMGFDAPKTDVVCITRPTTSPTLYEQMVGRGLRGPKNGGTEQCHVLDVQDEGLPEGIQSYGRVKKLWDSVGRKEGGPNGH
jgi:superfamily II DNA or RNA helicase